MEVSMEARQLHRRSVESKNLQKFNNLAGLISNARAVAGACLTIRNLCLHATFNQSTNFFRTSKEHLSNSPSFFFLQQ